MARTLAVAAYSLGQGDTYARESSILRQIQQRGEAVTPDAFLAANKLMSSIKKRWQLVRKITVLLAFALSIVAPTMPLLS